MQEKINALKEKWEACKERFAADAAFRKKTLIYGGIGVIAVLAIVLVCLLPGGSRGSAGQENTPDADGNDPVQEQQEENAANEFQAPVVEPEGMKEIFAKYEDAYAWLVIPGTGEVEESSGKPYHQQEDASGKIVPMDLSLPVMTHQERDHYLYRKYDGTDSDKGSLFTDSWVEGKFCNGTDMNDPVTVIYGHNQRNREMLGGMMAYALDCDFSSKDPYLMYIYQEGRRLTYRIFAGLQYDKCHILYNFDGLRDDETFAYFFNTEIYQFANGIINIDENHKPVPGDRVVILSVCKDGDTEHLNRNLIMGVLIEDTAVTEEKDMTPMSRAWLTTQKALAAKAEKAD